MYKNSLHNYGFIAICFHWLSVLGVTAIFALGVYMIDLDYYHPWYHSAPKTHSNFGLILAVVIALRFGWRTINMRLIKSNTQSSRNYQLTHSVHIGLYILLVCVLVSGYIMAAMDDNLSHWFGILQFPRLEGIDESRIDFIGKLHHWTSWALVALASAHGFAALYHHIILKDGTLWRMIPYNKHR